MNFLVSSVLNNSEIDYSSVFELIDGSEFSLDVEKKLVRFMKEFKDQYQDWPSYITITSNVGVEFEESDPLPVPDLLFHWQNKFAAMVS